MIETIVSHFVFLLISLLVGPFLLIAGFQILQGQRLKLPAVGKPVMKFCLQIGKTLIEIADLIAKLVASRLPAQYVHLSLPVQATIKCLCVVLQFWLLIKFLQGLF
ncbi:MAG: hypothetical protein IAF58_04590 [Leptolyngbya sp.]|nr:hypothetical protein [Candidatus Melainabacteria bacterium]